MQMSCDVISHVMVLDQSEQSKLGKALDQSEQSKLGHKPSTQLTGSAPLVTVSSQKALDQSEQSKLGHVTALDQSE